MCEAEALMRRKASRMSDFARLWTGQSVSELGSQVTILAFPTLAVLGFHAGPAAVGALVAAGRLPFPVLALFAGAFVDRVRKRPVMIVCNVARLLVLIAIPLLSATGALHLWHLFVATIAMGVFTVFFDIAYLAYVPSLVGHERLLVSNSRLEVTMSAAQLGGPGIGGLLVQAFGAARAVLVDAGSFAFSALTMLTIRHHEPRATQHSKRHLFREIGEGLRHVFANPVLRAQILCMGAAGFFAHAWEGPLYVFAYDRLHISPGLLGAILTAEGAGALIATFFAPRVTRRLGVGPTITVLDGIAIGIMALIPLALYVPPAMLLFPVFAISGMAGTVGNIAQVTLRQSLSPERIQGRMTAVFRTVFWGTWPLGSLIGGIIAAKIGATTTIVAASLLGVLVNSSIVLTPLWRVRDFGSAPIAPESRRAVTDSPVGAASD
jgi:MFS family permease